MRQLGKLRIRHNQEEQIGMKVTLAVASWEVPGAGGKVPSRSLSELRLKTCL